jgi:hypothetical protein
MPTLPVGDGPTYEALSAMISPALFLTGNASLIISTSNRMSRIVDRIRTLNDLADQLDRGVTELDYVQERLTHINSELGHLTWRSDRVRFSLTFLYMALSAFVGTSLALGADVLLAVHLRGLPSGLAVVGVVLMLTAAVNLTREARRALRSNRQEVRFYRDLRARRRADRAAAADAPAPSPEAPPEPQARGRGPSP